MKNNIHIIKKTHEQLNIIRQKQQIKQFQNNKTKVIIQLLKQIQEKHENNTKNTNENKNHQTKANTIKNESIYI